MLCNRRIWYYSTWPTLVITAFYLLVVPHIYEGVKAWAQTPPQWDERQTPLEWALFKADPADADGVPAGSDPYAGLPAGFVKSWETTGRGLLDKAGALGNHPVLIYEFVRNEIEYEAYPGSRFGAVGTLERGRGNDVDQALLLAALLRAAYFNLRRGEPKLMLVRGDVKLTGRQALGWLGVENGLAVQAYLNNAGVGFRDFAGSLTNENFSLVLTDHVWLRGDLEFGPYRGTRFVEGEDGILADLDASFVMQEAVEDAPEPFELSGIDPQTFVEQVEAFATLDVNAGAVSGIPEAFMLQQADSGAAVLRRLLEAENLTVENLLEQRRPTVERIDALPDALPYELVSPPAAFALSDELEGGTLPFLSWVRHRVQVRVVNSANGTEIVAAILPTSALYGRPWTIHFKGELLDGDLDDDSPTTWTAEVSVTPNIELDGEEVVYAGNPPMTPVAVAYGAPVRLELACQTTSSGAAPLEAADTEKQFFESVAGGFFTLAAVPGLNSGSQPEYRNRYLALSGRTSGGGRLSSLEDDPSESEALGPSLDLAAQAMLAQSEVLIRLGAIATGHRAATLNEWALCGLEPVAVNGGGFDGLRYIFAMSQSPVNLRVVVPENDPRLVPSNALQDLLQLTRDALLAQGPQLTLSGAVQAVSAGRLIRDGNAAGFNTYAVFRPNADDLGANGDRVPVYDDPLQTIRANLQAAADGGAVALLASGQTHSAELSTTNTLGRGWGYLLRHNSHDVTPAIEGSNSSQTQKPVWQSSAVTTTGLALTAFSAQELDEELRLTPGDLIDQGTAKHYQRLTEQAIRGVESYNGAARATLNAYIAATHSLAKLTELQETAFASQLALHYGSAVVYLHALLDEFSRPEVLSIELELFADAEAETGVAPAPGGVFNPAYYEKIVAHVEYNQIVDRYNAWAYDGSNVQRGQFTSDTAILERRAIDWVLKHEGTATADVFAFVGDYYGPNEDYNGTFELRAEGWVEERKTRQFAREWTIDTKVPDVRFVHPNDPLREYRGDLNITGTAHDLHFKEYTLERRASGAAGWAQLAYSEQPAPGASRLGFWDADNPTQPVNGEYELRLSASDVAGNTTQTVQSMKLRNDVWRPALTLDPDTTPQNGEITLRFTASEGRSWDSGLRKVKAWIEYTEGRYDKEHADDDFKTLLVTQRSRELFEQSFSGNPLPAAQGGLPEEFEEEVALDTQLLQGYANAPLVIHFEATDDFGNMVRLDHEIKLNNPILNAYLSFGSILAGTRTDLLVFTDSNIAPTAVLNGQSLTRTAYDSFVHGGEITYLHVFIINNTNPSQNSGPSATGRYPISIAHAGKTRIVDLFVFAADIAVPKGMISAPLNTILLKDKPNGPGSTTGTVAIEGYVFSEAFALNDRADDLPIEKELPASRPFWKLSYKPSSSKPYLNKVYGVEDSKPGDLLFTNYQNYVNFEPNWIELDHGFNWEHGEDPQHQGILPSDLNDITTTTLFQWDISRLPVGNYDLRLVVTDGIVRNGQILYQLVYIPGYKVRRTDMLPGEPEPEPGVLELRQVDFAMNFEGFPVSIVREYNSFRAFEKGDFGWGWKLEGTELKSVITENENVSYSSRLEADITLPDGRMFTYANNPPIAANDGFSNAWIRREEFITRPFGQMLWLPGWHYNLFDGGLDALYGEERNNTIGYKKVQEYLNGGTPNGSIGCLQLEDGAFILFDWNTGNMLRKDYDNPLQGGERDTVRKVTYQEQTDDSIRIADHLGRSIKIHRNPDGLVDWVEDPRGKRVTYEYNDNDELYCVTNRVGGKRWFHYNDPEHPHFLTKYVIDRQPRPQDVVPEYPVPGTYGIEDEHDLTYNFDYNDDSRIDTRSTEDIVIDTDYIEEGDNLREIETNLQTGTRKELLRDSEGRVIQFVASDGRITDIVYNPSDSPLDTDVYTSGGLKSISANGLTCDFKHRMAPYKQQYFGYEGIAQQFIDFWINELSGYIEDDFDTNGNIKPGYVTANQAAPTEFDYSVTDSSETNSNSVNGYIRYDKGTGPNDPKPDGDGKIYQIKNINGQITNFDYKKIGTENKALSKITHPNASHDDYLYFEPPHQFTGRIHQIKKYQDSQASAPFMTVTFTYESNEAGYAELISKGIESQWMEITTQTVVNLQSGVTRTGSQYRDAMGNILASGSSPDDLSFVKLNGENQVIFAKDIGGDQIENYFTADGLQYRTKTTSDGDLSDNISIYDDQGRIIKVVSGDEEVDIESFANGHGVTVVINSPDGAIRTEIYDSSNRLIRETNEKDGVEQTTEYGYDTNGNRNYVKNPTGEITEWEFDSMGRVTLERKINNGRELVHRTGFDAKGSEIWTQNPRQYVLGIYTTYRYTDDFQIAYICHNDNDNDPNNTPPADAYYEEFTYDPDTDQKATDTRPRQVGSQLLPVATKYIYDQGKYSQVIMNFLDGQSETNAQNVTFDFQYDSNNRLAGITYPSGLTWSMAELSFTDEERIFENTFIGGAHKKRQETHKDSYTLLVDAMGNEIKSVLEDSKPALKTIKPAGQAVAYHHKIEGESVFTYLGEAGSGNELRKVTHHYNPEGKISEVITPEGTIRYFYDQHGRLIQRSFLNQSILYTYDDLNRIKTVESGDGLWNFSYDLGGLLEKIENMKTGMKEEYEYNTLGHATRMKVSRAGIAIYDATYGRSPSGQLLEIMETLNGQTTQINYSYDALGRLTGEQSVELNINRTYTYNSDSGIATVTNNGQTETYNYQTNTQRLAGINRPGGAVTNNWDGNGRLTSQTVSGATTSYEWSVEGYLKAVNRPDGSRVEYAYDHAGNLVNCVIKDAQQQVVRDVKYLVDPFGSSGYPQIIAEIEGSSYRFYTHHQRPAACSTLNGLEGETAYFVSDLLGSVRAELSEAGEVRRTWSYDSFGNIRGGVASIGVNDPAPPLEPLYAGEMVSRLTGLSYNRARWYDPGSRIWLSSDPVFDFPQGFGNEYAYAGQNPISLTDPTGTQSSSLIEQGVVGHILLGLTLLGAKYGSGIGNRYINPFAWIQDSITDNYNDITALPNLITEVTNEHIEIKVGPLFTQYQGTFINGILNQREADALEIAKSLQNSYGIPMKLIYNPTIREEGGYVLNLMSTIGDLSQSVVQTFAGYAYGSSETNPYGNQEKTVKTLVEEWLTILKTNENTKIVHFAHSQGTIITRMALGVLYQRAKTELQMSRKDVADRFYYVMFGVAYAYKKDGNNSDLPVFEGDPHFHNVICQGDIVVNTVGTNGFNWWSSNELGFGPLVTSYIAGYPDWAREKEGGDVFPYSEHSFYPHTAGMNGDPWNYRGIVPNTYGWWIKNVGGKVFNASNGNIHGENYWIAERVGAPLQQGMTVEEVHVYNEYGYGKIRVMIPEDDPNTIGLADLHYIEIPDF